LACHEMYGVDIKAAMLGREAALSQRIEAV